MGEQDPSDEQCFCLYLTNNGKKDKTSYRPASEIQFTSTYEVVPVALLLTLKIKGWVMITMTEK